MEKDFTQEDYEISKVMFRDMLKMFRSKHEGNTAIDEYTLRNFAGFYSWCIVVGIIPFNIKIPYNKIIVILENGLDLYFGSMVINRPQTLTLTHIPLHLNWAC